MIRKSPHQWSPAKPLMAASSSRSGALVGVIRIGLSRPVSTNEPAAVLHTRSLPATRPRLHPVADRPRLMAVQAGRGRPAQVQAGAPAAQQHPLGGGRRQQADAGVGVVVAEDLLVGPAVLGVAERAVLGHADAVAPAVPVQREQGRPGSRRGAEQQRSGCGGHRQQSADEWSQRPHPFGRCTSPAGRRPARVLSPATAMGRCVDNLPEPMNPIALLPPPLRAAAEILLTLVMAALIAYLAQPSWSSPTACPPPAWRPPCSRATA